MVVYQVQNNVNDKRYIGLTTMGIEERWKCHIRDMKKHKDIKFYRAMNKYGAENFTISILEDGIKDLETLNEREIHWIKYYDSYRNGYNSTTGGEISPTLFPEVREKISKALKGKKRSKEHCKNIGLAKKGVPGHKHTEEHKKWISQKLKGIKRTPEQNERNRQAGLGVKQSKETIEKRMKYVRGVPKSESHRVKLAKILNENRFIASGKDHPSSVAVIQINKTTGEVINRFDTVTRAEIALNVNPNSGGISKVINGRRETAYGYKWERARR